MSHTPEQRRQVRRFLLLAVVVASPAVAQTRPDTPPTQAEIAEAEGSGFVTGQEFRNMREAQQVVYLMGMIDGLQNQSVFGPLDMHRIKNVDLFLDCISGKTSGQLAAMSRKFVGAHPERWHENMRFLFWDMLRQHCPYRR